MMLNGHVYLCVHLIGKHSTHLADTHTSTQYFTVWSRVCLAVQVDNYQPIIHTFPLSETSDTILDDPTYLYVGNNGGLMLVGMCALWHLYRVLLLPGVDVTVTGC